MNEMLLSNVKQVLSKEVTLLVSKNTLFEAMKKQLCSGIIDDLNLLDLAVWTQDNCPFMWAVCVEMSRGEGSHGASKIRKTKTKSVKEQEHFKVKLLIKLCEMSRWQSLFSLGPCLPSIQLL